MAGASTVGWTVLAFGKHQGRTLPEVLFRDPSWFFRARSAGALKGSLAEEAEDLYWKSRTVRVPQLYDEGTQIEYFYDHETREFRGMEPVSVAEGPGGVRGDFIDFTKPLAYVDYSARGFSRFLGDLKFFVFKDRDYQPSRRECEEFFEDDSNFGF